MSYLSLYRRYRPLTFEQVVGQKHVIQALKNAYERNKIVHAYLFSGPRGTGKTTVAKCFARLINQFDESVVQHADIIEIDAASHNGVDDVREIIDRVKYSPLEAKYKVYIIDEVHMLSNGAFNALLKTLEEPPEHVVFILATTEIHKVLPTIISRTQKYDFLSVSREQILERLEEVCQSEGVEYQIQALKIIASLSAGGLRDALTILEQVIAYSKYPITVSDVIDVYKLVTIEQKIEFINNIINNELEKSIQFLKRFKKDSIDFKLLISDLITLSKDIITYRLTKKFDYCEVISEEFIDNIILEYDYQKFMNGLIEIFENSKNNRILEEMLEVYVLNLLLKNKSDNQNVVDKNLSRKDNINIQVSDNSKDVDDVKEKKVINKLSDECLLDFMICADKNRRINDQEIYKNIYIECALPAYYAISDSMISSQVVVSGADYIIISNDNDIYVESLLQQIDLVKELMNNLYSDNRAVLIVNHKHFEEVTKKFMLLYKNRQLSSIDDSYSRIMHYLKNDNQQPLDRLKSVFDDIVIE